MSRLPPFRNGLRVVPCYDADHGTLWRIEHGARAVDVPEAAFRDDRQLSALLSAPVTLEAVRTFASG